MSNNKRKWQRGQRAARVYAQLRKDILRLNLAPGELLDATQISSQFELSHSPIREAIVRLSNEGFVKALPNKNPIVAPLNIAEFPSYVDALDLVQRIAMRLAARLRTREQLKRIKQYQVAFSNSVIACDPIGMIERNYDFHIAICDASQNRYLTEFNSRLLDEGRRYLRLYFRSTGDTLPTELNEEHDRIIDAIEHRDEELTEHLAHHHSLQMSQRFLGCLSRRKT